jgi:hypothetical protein
MMRVLMVRSYPAALVPKILLVDFDPQLARESQNPGEASSFPPRKKPLLAHGALCWRKVQKFDHPILAVIAERYFMSELIPQ